MERLNTIQSVVYETATTTDENLLVSAPTGAGKTNIAMLAILKVIKDHMDYNSNVIKDAFKVCSLNYPPVGVIPIPSH